MAARSGAAWAREVWLYRLSDVRRNPLCDWLHAARLINRKQVPKVKDAASALRHPALARTHWMDDDEELNEQISDPRRLDGT